MISLESMRTAVVNVIKRVPWYFNHLENNLKTIVDRLSDSFVPTPNSWRKPYPTTNQFLDALGTPIEHNE